MAKPSPTETYDVALKGGPAASAGGLLSRGAFPLFDVPTTVMIAVSLITAYLVLPPLYSVVQTSLFTTKLTGEIDEFTFLYYKNLFSELRVLGPFLNTVYFSIGSAILATTLGGSIAWLVVRSDTPLRSLV